MPMGVNNKKPGPSSAVTQHAGGAPTDAASASSAGAMSSARLARCPVAVSASSSAASTVSFGTPAACARRIISADLGFGRTAVSATEASSVQVKLA